MEFWCFYFQKTTIGRTSYVNISCLSWCLCWILMEWREDIAGWMPSTKISIDITALLIWRNSRDATQSRNFVSTTCEINVCLCIWTCMRIQPSKETSPLGTLSTTSSNKLNHNFFLKSSLRIALVLSFNSAFSRESTWKLKIVLKMWVRKVVEEWFFIKNLV